MTSYQLPGFGGARVKTDTQSRSIQTTGWRARYVYIAPGGGNIYNESLSFDATTLLDQGQNVLAMAPLSHTATASLGHGQNIQLGEILAHTASASVDQAQRLSVGFNLTHSAGISTSDSLVQQALNLLTFGIQVGLTQSTNTREYYDLNLGAAASFTQDVALHIAADLPFDVQMDIAGEAGSVIQEVLSFGTSTNILAEEALPGAENLGFGAIVSHSLVSNAVQSLTLTYSQVANLIQVARNVAVTTLLHAATAYEAISTAGGNIELLTFEAGHSLQMASVAYAQDTHLYAQTIGVTGASLVSVAEALTLAVTIDVATGVGGQVHTVLVDYNMLAGLAQDVFSVKPEVIALAQIMGVSFGTQLSAAAIIQFGQTIGHALSSFVFDGTIVPSKVVTLELGDRTIQVELSGRTIAVTLKD